MASLLQNMIQGMGGDTFSNPGGVSMGMGQSQQGGGPTSVDGNVMSKLMGNITPTAPPLPQMGSASTANAGALGQPSPSILAPPASPTANGGMYQMKAPGNIQDVSQLDPFNMDANVSENPPYFNESTSPGNQAYGGDWATLLNSLKDIKQVAPYTGREMGGSTGPTGMSALSSFLSPDAFNAVSGDKDLQTQMMVGGITPAARSMQLNKINQDINPLGFVGGSNNDFGGLQENGLAGQIQKGYNGDNFSDYASQVLPVLSKQFGLDPNNPQSKNYSNAFVTDAVQTPNQQQYEDYMQAKQNSGSFESLLGNLVGGAAFGLAGTAPGLFAGIPAGAAGFGEALSNAMPSFESAFSTIPGAFNTVAGNLNTLLPPEKQSLPTFANSLGPNNTFADVMLSGINPNSMQGWNSSGNVMANQPNYSMRTAANA